MSDLAKVVQKLFGSTAGADQISVFGSKFAGVPSFTTDPATIQSLGNFLEGWYSGAVGGSAPTIQDMNALFVLLTYQIAYLQQKGISEWDATAQYIAHKSVVQAGGYLFLCTVDSLNDTPLSSLGFIHWTLLAQGNMAGGVSAGTVLLNPTTRTFITSAAVDSVYTIATPSSYADNFPVGAEVTFICNNTAGAKSTISTDGLGLTINGLTSYPTGLLVGDSLTLRCIEENKLFVV